MEVVPDWLLAKTFAVQYSPNCNRKWLVRLVGFRKGILDNLPPGKSHDAIGTGGTFKDAAEAALQAYGVSKSLEQESRLSNVNGPRSTFKDEVFREGRMARTANEKVHRTRSGTYTQCPYQIGSEEAVWWQEGYEYQDDVDAG